MNKNRLPLLHPRQLEAVIAVARTGAVHAAARELAIPQPAVSRLVASAERALGVTLFARSRSGTHVTEIGERVLKQVAFALHSLEDIAEAAREPQWSIRLGCIPRAMHTLIPHLLTQIGDGTEKFRLHVSVAASTELAAELKASRLDFMIARLTSTPGTTFETEELYSERTVTVCGRDNRAVPETTCSIAQLAKQQWVLPKRGFYSRDLIDALLASNGLHPIVPVIETNSFESSLSVVAATCFMTIAPEFAARRFEQLKLVRVVSTRPSLGASPILLQYQRSQRNHPGYEAFRDAVMRSAQQVHLL